MQISARRSGSRTQSDSKWLHVIHGVSRDLAASSRTSDHNVAPTAGVEEQWFVVLDQEVIELEIDVGGETQMR